MTKTDTVNKESISLTLRKIKQYNPEAPVYTAQHKPVSLINVSGELRNPDWLNNRSLYAFAGIANELYFKVLLQSHGANIVKFRGFRDHCVYRQRDISDIKKEAGVLEIITTEKDLVKLAELEVPESFYALKIEFSIDKNFYDHIFGIEDA